MPSAGASAAADDAGDDAGARELRPPVMNIPDAPMMQRRCKNRACYVVSAVESEDPAPIASSLWFWNTRGAMADKVTANMALVLAGRGVDEEHGNIGDCG